MRTIALFSFLHLIAFHSTAQGLRFGVLGGAHISAFTTSNPLPGVKAAGVVMYEFDRLTIDEQMGVTLDRALTNFAQITRRHNEWRYVWFDATTILGYKLVRRQGYDVALGSGISVRRVIPSSIDGKPYGVGTYHDRMHDWTFFVPVRLSMVFKMANERKLNCGIDYQVQVRKMYEPLPYQSSSDFTSQINKLFSIGLYTAYLF